MSSSSSSKTAPANFPEFAVRRETISAYFSPPLPSSTFYDLVNKGRITPMKGLKGFYKLNDSLRRLGLREVASLPEAQAARTMEEIVRLAFHVIDPRCFTPPSWLLPDDVVIGETEAALVERIMAQHGEAVAGLDDVILKLSYLQGVLDAEALLAEDRRLHGG